MKDPKLTPVVYEYRYANLPEGVRSEINRNRYSLFERNSREYRNIKTSTNWDLLITKLGIISGIALMVYVVSLLV